jgi:hypothetical protein
MLVGADIGRQCPAQSLSVTIARIAINVGDNVHDIAGSSGDVVAPHTRRFTIRARGHGDKCKHQHMLPATIRELVNPLHVCALCPRGLLAARRRHALTIRTPRP